MHSIKMTLMYDGTDYCGWQRQPKRKSIQGEVERALSVFTREPVCVIGASRTDAGVHAAGYVCSFQTACDASLRDFSYGMNGILPRDIRVKEMEAVPDRFHARYDAQWKTYVYTIDNSAYRDPFWRRYAWHFRYPLNVDTMRRAAADYIGTHDFSAFMSSGGEAKDFTRTIYHTALEQQGHLLHFSVTGNGFLYNMVRIMAGTLVSIGNGRLPAEELPAVIASGERKRAGITAPPEGLCLKEIGYYAWQ